MRFYNELLGFDFTLGAAFNDNRQMAATAGAAGASFRQSTATIPGTSQPMTLIEFKTSSARSSRAAHRSRHRILQLIVRDVTALTKKLKDAGVPVVTTGGAPVDITPAGAQDLARARPEQHAARAHRAAEVIDVPATYRPPRRRRGFARRVGSASNGFSGQ